MALLDSGRARSLSASTIYHSCVGDDLSESYCNDPQPWTPSFFSTEPRLITNIHYEELQRSLEDRLSTEHHNFRAKARQKLILLTPQQFQEFTIDVYDELIRIQNNKERDTKIPFLLIRIDYPAQRNQARQKIATLSPGRLKDLVSDVFYELGRRYPEFKRSITSPKISDLSDRVLAHSEVAGYSGTQRAGLSRSFSSGDISRSGFIMALRLSGGPVDTISSSMSITDIIAILGQHGCPEITTTLDLSRCGQLPVAGGGFGDIYQGYLQNGVEVAIKCARVFVETADLNRVDFKSAACELYAWSKFNHRNVVELLGLAHFRERIAMVSPWMKNGNLRQCLARFPNIDRCRICHEIASGLAYLHEMDTVHGDVKALNVLISVDGTAKLIDFGNSALKNSTLEFTGSLAASAFSIRWTAPELLIGSSGYSQEADVYALGMTILEVITGELPFTEVKTDVAVMARVFSDHRQPPKRPCHCIPASSRQGDHLWGLLIECWSYDPLSRPLASHIENQIAEITCDGLRAVSPRGEGRLGGLNRETRLFGGHIYDGLEGQPIKSSTLKGVPTK